MTTLRVRTHARILIVPPKMGPKKIAAYLVFAGEMREPAKAELVAGGDPKPGMGDIAKKVGEKWKSMTDEQKNEYKTKADAINAENEKEYQAKVASGEIDEAAEGEKDDGEVDLSLPLARVKRIMRLDKEVKNTAVDAVRLVSRATELFVESLVEGAFGTMKAAKRKTIKHSDVEHHVLRKPRLEFLHDHVWAMRPAAPAMRDKENVDGEENDGPKSPPEAPAGVRQITEIFGKAPAAVETMGAPTEGATEDTEMAA